MNCLLKEFAICVDVTEGKKEITPSIKIAQLLSTYNSYSYEHQSGLQDVAFLLSRDSHKTVLGGMQGHPPCKIFLLRQIFLMAV